MRINMDKSFTRRKWPAFSGLSLMFMFWSCGVLAQLPPECGTLDNFFGPFDYRAPPQGSLLKVEEAHFDANVAKLQKHAKCQLNKSRCSPVKGDLTYTLNVFPNHHRALVAMAQYHLFGLNRDQGNMRFSAECYFRRAIEFRPDDAAVRMIHAYYLSETGKPDRARGEYEMALELAPDSAEVNYNAGLFFLEVNDIEKARECAIRAYDLGHPLPGLRNGLTAKGVSLD